MQISGRGLLLAGLLAIAAAPARAEPVYVGGEADYDACGSVGEVRGLNPNGDNFLAVRSGPGSKNKMLDKVFTGQSLYVCDEKGGWYGVVYGRGDCGVSSPIDMREPYSGPCRSGWVSARFVEIVAG